MTKSSSKRQARVFLSYAYEDREAAELVAEALRTRGVDVWYDDWALAPGDSIVDLIDKAIFSSDYIIILLSPNSVESKWVMYELGAALMFELTARDVTVIPVAIGDCEIPAALKERAWIDLRDFGTNLSILVEQVANAPRIDFSRLDGRAFEGLVGDLLERLGFTNIEHEARAGEWWADIQAEYLQRDPFGARIKETWVVETKLYKSERADIRSLHQLRAYLETRPEMHRGLLVTNGQLTSTAKKWLQDTRDRTRAQVRVIEGPELKKLLLLYPDLIRKHFPGTQEGGDQ